MYQNYQTDITRIGNLSLDGIAEGMLILFKQDAPEDIAEYCLLHSHSQLQRPILVGDLMTFNHQDYLITAVGDIASENLAQLGHITLFFDGAEIAQFPGAIHLQGNVPEHIVVGHQITFSSLSI
ncbi:PTS glucitol/sorbitol transporter subunit IIA [Pasteurellaceae bacterium Macca]|nr:PTS glucitol/sorbitol transporter subunit IIA [Pasteurellaceae bacterium Macca]